MLLKALALFGGLMLIVAALSAMPLGRSAQAVDVVREPYTSGSMVLMPSGLASPQLRPAAAPALLDDVGTGSPLSPSRAELVASIPAPAAAPSHAAAVAARPSRCGD